MSSSLRQKPPKDRSAAYAALILAGLLLAGCIGWMASSMFSDVQQTAERSNNGGQQDHALDESAGSSSPKSDEAASESDENKSPKRPDAELPNRDGDPARRNGPESLDSETRMEGTPAKIPDGKLELDSATLEKEIAKGPPKLSDLASYKKNPNQTRVKSTQFNRRKTKSRVSPQKNVSSGAGASQGRGSSHEKEQGSASTEGQGVQSVAENQFAFEQSVSDLVFYQELIVDRNPIFAIEGISALKQKFKYRTVSRITVHPGKNGFRRVSQKVVGANLISADAISRKSIEESVKKLIGKEFQFTLDKKQKVVDFKGEKEPPKSIDFKDLTAIDGFKGDGFMVSSVMDLDGWREMAQLTFLLPDDKRKKWSDQMEHDWGELGRWVGETRFEKKGESNSKLRIDYAHFMRYETAPKGDSKLPFALGEIAMESKEAGGRLFFDREKRRIDSLIERFQVSGSIGASLLGGSTKLKIQETQTFELKLHDQNPQ